MIIDIKTYRKTEVIDITAKIESYIKGDGLVNIFAKHTTTAIIVADLDPNSDTDLLQAIQAMTPKVNWIHPHDPDHYPDHLFSSLLGVSLTIPFLEGKLELGKWQKIIFVELDGPKNREIALSFIQTQEHPTTISIT